MSNRQMALSRAGRPIVIASYQAEEAANIPATVSETAPADIPEAVVPMRALGRMRRHFPEAGAEYEGGHSDGYEYRCVFNGSNLAASLEMIRAFLQQEGYAEVPLPKDELEMLLFRNPSNRGQMLLYTDNGYVHNPIKILFPPDRRKKSQLILCIYNEQMSDHLIRFHGLTDRKRALELEQEAKSLVK